jgi:hypothetical protein
MYAALRPPGQARGSRPAFRGPARGRFLPSRPAGLRGGPPVAAPRSAPPCRPFWPSPRLRPSLRVLGRPPPARVRVAGLKPALAFGSRPPPSAPSAPLSPVVGPCGLTAAGRLCAGSCGRPGGSPLGPGSRSSPRGGSGAFASLGTSGGRVPSPRGVFAAPPCRLLALARLLRVRFPRPLPSPFRGKRRVPYDLRVDKTSKVC